MIVGTFLIVALLIAAQGLYRNYGRTTFDALPDGLNQPHDWDGKDHDKVWYTRWVKYVKGWFAVGPLSAYSWARWRSAPIDLFKINDGSKWRIETVNGYRYTSRVQYWSRWHLLVQWPFSISFHVYYRRSDVPPMYERPEDLGISKLFFAYGPTHFDADQVYWILSFFVGGQWK